MATVPRRKQGWGWVGADLRIAQPVGVSQAVDYSARLTLRPGLPGFCQGLRPIVYCTPKLCCTSVRMRRSGIVR